MTVGTSRSDHGRPGAQGFRILRTQPPCRGRSVPLYNIAGGTPIPEEQAPLRRTQKQPLGRRRLQIPLGCPRWMGVFRGKAWRNRGRSLELDSHSGTRLSP